MGLGTGKSRCCIAFSERAEIKSTLILCPLSVCDAWLEQYTRFSSQPPAAIAALGRGSVAKKLKQAKDTVAMAKALGHPPVIVVNYESARNQPLARWLEAQHFELLVLDEAHKIKSPAGTTSRWVSRLSKACKRKIACTGTVLPHSPMDAYGLFRALDPTIFGWSFVKFRRKFAVMGGFQGKQIQGFKALPELREKMGRITFQADRSVLTLPPAMHERRVVDLGPKGRRMYDAMERDFVAKVEEGVCTASNALVRLLRLQQMTSGAATIEVESSIGIETVKIDDAKEQAVQEIFNALPAAEPIVVFGRFKHDLRSIHRAAAATGRKSLELSGARRELKEWQLGEAPVLACQIQSGGTGIDLVRACYVVFISVGWSLADLLQAVARSHRPGQDRAVSYYHIVARGTVDETVYNALRDRKNLVDSVLEGIYKGQSVEAGA